MMKRKPEERPVSAMRRPSEGDGSGEMPKVQDALCYLERVKLKFSDKPNVYIQFLDIMKDFKAQSIDTDGVIKRVKQLFDGNKELILGFNQFLPPGFKIELADLEREGLVNSAAKPMEFGHAVKYVAKIKARYASKPEIYEEFLEILHQYQQNRAIEDIFSRVQVLFAGQKDLLDEFAYFLPDSNPEYAKKAKKVAMKAPMRGRGRGRGSRGGGRGSRKYQFKAIEEEEEEDVYEEEEAPRQSRPQHTSHAKTVTYPPGSERVILVLDRIKSAIPKGYYIQILKCMHLFTIDIISMSELVALVESLLADVRSSDLAEKFKNAIGYDEADANISAQKNRTNYYAYMQSVELNSTIAVSASYRKLPDEVPVPLCSGRTELCQSVLNDRCYSIPSGTEDFSFKITRKNQYEEAIFKAEDDRYELDIIIENNNSVVKFLESELVLLQKKSDEDQLKYRLSQPLTAIQCRSITRVYGDLGQEILQLISSAPKNSIPTVLNRLRSKDLEWRKIKHDFKKSWREVYEKNYVRSLDHRSFYFKQDDKKKTSAKGLCLEIREIHDQVYPNPLETSKCFSSTIKPFGCSNVETNGCRTFTDGHCMKMKLSDPAIHDEVLTVVLAICDAKANAFEKQMFLEFWVGFICPFFRINPARGNSILSSYEPSKKPVIPSNDKSKAEEDILAAVNARLAESSSRASVGNALISTLKFVAESNNTYTSSVQTLQNVYKSQGVSINTEKDGSKSKVCLLGDSVLPESGNFHPAPIQPAVSSFILGAPKLYVFFRMYELIYSRLLKAHELASKSTGNQVYASFQKLLLDWLSGTIETAKYEDDCRFSLGAGSFCLFTLDKCGLQLIQCISEILVPSDGTDTGLWQFDWYVRFMRQLAAKPANISSAKKNYSAYVSSRLPDECFHVQIEYNSENRELYMGLIEHEISASVLNTPALAVSQNWSQFVHEAIGTNNAPLDSLTKQYLEKCGYASFSDVFGKSERSNKLSFTINLPDYTPIFVEDSENYFFYTGPAKSLDSEARVARISAWRASMGGVPPTFENQQEDISTSVDAASLLQRLASQNDNEDNEDVEMLESRINSEMEYESEEESGSEMEQE